MLQQRRRPAQLEPAGVGLLALVFILNGQDLAPLQSLRSACAPSVHNACVHMCVRVCACVCVCGCERETEREREAMPQIQYPPEVSRTQLPTFSLIKRTGAGREHCFHHLSLPALQFSTQQHQRLSLERGGAVYTCSVCRIHLATRDHVVSEVR